MKRSCFLSIFGFKTFKLEMTFFLLWCRECHDRKPQPEGVPLRSLQQRVHPGVLCARSHETEQKASHRYSKGNTHISTEEEFLQASDYESSVWFEYWAFLESVIFCNRPWKIDSLTFIANCIKKTVLFPGFRICIHCLRIRIQNFQMNRDPHPITALDPRPYLPE